MAISVHPGLLTLPGQQIESRLLEAQGEPVDAQQQNGTRQGEEQRPQVRRPAKAMTGGTLGVLVLPSAKPS